jgi:hypothetical protein
VDGTGCTALTASETSNPPTPAVTPQRWVTVAACLLRLRVYSMTFALRLTLMFS